jgi:hypothetical protein
MSCESTYNILDFNEWFVRFCTPHPQLQYFKDEQDLLNLQIILSKNYIEKLYTKEEVINIYHNYIMKKKEEHNRVWEIKSFYENKIKLLVNIEKEKTNKFIKNLINEI